MIMNIKQDSEHLPPQLSNGIVCLRRGKISDYERIRAYREDLDNSQYIRPPESEQETYELVEKLTKPWQFTVNSWNGFVICKVDDDTPLGEMVFNVRDWECRRAEIGYRLSNDAAGQGICTQAAQLLIDYLLTNFDFVKLVARCDTRNVASYRVMEKLGFKREAHFKQHYLNGTLWIDQYDYGLLASEWTSPQ